MDGKANDAVQALCQEIGFPCDYRMERSEVLVAFVAELVGEVEHQRWISERLVEAGGKAPSDGSTIVLKAAREMLEATTDKARIKQAAQVHDLCREHNPEAAYPTDHLIDMVSSCASAIRFGLEKPCRSRHAAEAANHVWKQRYGISCFDSATSAWGHDWARQRLISALISMALNPLAQASLPEGGER